jgi:hypothetical protein
MRYGCTDKSNPNCFRLWLKLVSSYSWLVNELGMPTISTIIIHTTPFLICYSGYNSGYIPNQPLSYKWRVQLPEGYILHLQIMAHLTVTNRPCLLKLCFALALLQH